jgi:hypothetical protein
LPNGLDEGKSASMWQLAWLVLSATPAPEVSSTLPPIPAPLGHIGGVITPLPSQLSQSDRPVTLAFEGCEVQVVWLMHALGGTIRAVEQLQQWLDRTGLEKTIYKKKQVLAEVVRQLSEAKFEPRMVCAEPKRGRLELKEGFKLDLKEAPKTFCEAPEGRSTGDFWFFNGEHPSAVVNVSKGEPDLCAPRLSVMLFDRKGLGRVRLSADWGGVMSANLLGDSCKSVDFDFSAEKQAFVATLKSCKR